VSERARAKAVEVRRLCAELRSIAPGSLEAYRDDLLVKAACERYSERIVEACTDLAFMVIKGQGLRAPEDDKEAFSVLADDGVIGPELCERMREAKGMRNILAHQYARVDDRIVFEAITEELPRDAEEFAAAVLRALGKGRRGRRGQGA
jgi:uncharacterized protein YutE (UPF0331/DUF86 family)